ncbi:nuclear transport factor 2 family protein [Rubrivirga sp. IMCC45206]|uniref:nuclear transport factor 2 family protein n=1 Tax=Rubrivirga sp. IMCC45206 TaxID=3391614 RepID=UPI00398FE968
MRHLALALALALLAPAVFAQTSDHDQVVEAVSYYLDGGTAGDFDVLARAFHPSATMRWLDGGDYRDVNALDFFRRGMETRDPEAPPSNRVTRVASVTVSGDAASAVLEIEYPTFTFVDHMTLLRFDDGWKIVSKAFHRRPHAHTD